MADTALRVRAVPRWALLCLLICLAADAAWAADAETSNATQEATTVAISPLAADTRTQQPDRDEEDDDDGDGDSGSTKPEDVLQSNATKESVPTDVQTSKDGKAGDEGKDRSGGNEKDEESDKDVQKGEADEMEDDEGGDDEDGDDDEGDDDEEQGKQEASTSKSVKITVSKVTGSGKGPDGEKRSLEAEVIVAGPEATEKTKLAEDTLHAPAVELMQGPRRRRRPTPAAQKDDRRVVRQGDGSYRSREALAARNARSRKAAGRPPKEESQTDSGVAVPGNELPPKPESNNPKKRKSTRRRKPRKGSRKTTSTTTSPSEVWSRDAEAPVVSAVNFPSPPSLVTEPPLPVTNKYPDLPSTTGNPSQDDAKAASLRPEVRVTRQEDEAEASMEALQTATDEVRVARLGRQGRGRLNVNVQVPSVDFQQVDVNPDGSYRFAYNTNDEGQHFRIEQANSDNLVAGRYGYRDAEGRPSQTVYTAGPRGFRARGTDIARKMDLSQAGPHGPRPPPDGRYSPEYDNYFDPLEDPSYSFAFRTPTYVRKEDADSRGDVSGVYSYIDDVGERHVVQYEAGAEKGFNVINSFPDNVPAPGYHLGPGNPPRGRTTIVQHRDGSYRFVAAGPDSRREEVSDQVNNRRGSYSYIDDKGVQQTVEYIAGPGIGYRIVNKHKGVIIPPTYATSFPPFSSSPFPVSPTAPSFPSSSFSPFPSPYPTAFPSPFPETVPPSAFPPPFSSVAPFPSVSPFPSSTGRPGGSSTGRPGGSTGRPGGSSTGRPGGSSTGRPGGSNTGRPGYNPGGAGYPGSSSTTGRPNNQYIPPRPPPTSAPSIPPAFADLDDPFSELFPGETGTPLRPGSGAGTGFSSSGGRPGSVRPIKKPKPSVSIESGGDDDLFSPFSQSGGSGSGSTAGYPTTTTSSSVSTTGGEDDNTIDGLFGDGGDVSSTARPTQRPTSSGTYRPPASSTTGGSGDDFLDLFPSAGPSSSPASPSSSPRPTKRPRPRPRPRPPTSPRPTSPSTTTVDDFDSLFNPTPVYGNPSDIPSGGSSSTSGYDYTRPKKPLRRPGGSGGSGGSSSGAAFPTTIRPGRLPSRPSGDEDFLSEFEGGGLGGGSSGQWASGGSFWPQVPYGNCCPGAAVRVNPIRLRDERDDGGVYPGRPYPVGSMIRAHVQSVDLAPYEPQRTMDPGEALERFIRQEQSLHSHRQRSVDPADAPRPLPTAVWRRDGVPDEVQAAASSPVEKVVDAPAARAATLTNATTTATTKAPPTSSPTL